MKPSHNAILIGYFPKRVCKTPDWLKNPRVKEICSVSECISEGPEGWIELWQHNDMWVFNSPKIARSVIPRDLLGEYDIFAYRLIPIQFDNKETSAYNLPKLSPHSIPTSFALLGFDIVSRSCGNSFECSGLSCNHGAEKEPVNEFCLVESEAEAIRIAELFADESNGYEPGPYFIVEVWRELRE